MNVRECAPVSIYIRIPTHGAVLCGGSALFITDILNTNVQSTNNNNNKYERRRRKKCENKKKVNEAHSTALYSSSSDGVDRRQNNRKKREMNSVKTFAGDMNAVHVHPSSSSCAQHTTHTRRRLSHCHAEHMAKRVRYRSSRAPLHIHYTTTNEWRTLSMHTQQKNGRA